MVSPENSGCVFIEGAPPLGHLALFENTPPVPLRTVGVGADADGVEDVAVRHPIGGFVRAALALAQGDTVGARDRFLAFPDSLCPDAPRLREIRFRLLIATGQDSAAATLFDRSQDRWVPLVVERARVAERLGDRARAIKWYRFGADAARGPGAPARGRPGASGDRAPGRRATALTGAAVSVADRQWRPPPTGRRSYARLTLGSPR